MHLAASEWRPLSGPILPKLAAVALVLAASLVVAATPFLFGERDGGLHYVMTNLEIAPAQADAAPPRDGWRPFDDDFQSLDAPVTALRATFELPARAPGDPPLGLFLAGEYAARAFFNGVEIGAKGWPGDTAADEQTGPVDAVLRIPEELVGTGDNQVVLVLSAHHRTLGRNFSIHATAQRSGLAIDAYSARNRRSIGYYAAPLLMLVVYAGAGFALLLRLSRGEEASGESALALGVLAALMVIAGAEIFRAAVNYPYSWHGVRMGAQLLGATGFSAAIAALATKHARLGGVLAMSSAALVVALAAAALASQFDQRNTNAVIAGCICAIAILARSFSRPHAEAAALGAALAAALAIILIAACFGAKEFLDRLLYAASLPLTAVLVWPRPEPLRPAQPAQEDPAGEASVIRHVLIRAQGGQRVVPLPEIRAIRADGNYVEYELSSGERLSDHASLSELAARLPDAFVRVHRSHIVRLDAVTRIRTRGGGRHEAELDGGARVPVSRSRIAELRTLLEAGAGQNQRSSDER